MASFTREIDDWPTFSPITPQFLSIILEDTSKDKILSIPKKFAMKYGGDLSNQVFLKLPSGSSWKVELRRWDGEVWLDKGWPNFSEFYSLKKGHWLVFRYQGNSKFNVCIFDESCIEIDYPLTKPKKEQADEHDDSDDDSNDDSSDASGDDTDDVSVEVFKSFPPCPKTSVKSTLPRPQPRKKRRTSSSGQHDFPTEKRARVTSSIRSGKTIALKRAKCYKCKNPSFVVSMSPSYIYRSKMWLPSSFYKLHLIKDSCSEVILRVSNGRTWPVEFKYEGGRATFDGWMDVVHDNQLEVGDVCVFELISSNAKPLFDVVIFRSREGAKCASDGEETDHEDGDSTDDSGDDSSDNSVEVLGNCQRKTREKSTLQGAQPHKKSRTSSAKYDLPTEKDGGVTSSTRSEDAIALQRAESYKSRNPSSFIVSMRPSYIHHRFMWLPFEFRKQGLIKKSCEVILRVSDGRTWSVNLNEGKSMFTGGWMEVVHDNNLEVGDVCVFRWISNNVKPLLDVVIIRSREAAKCAIGVDECVEILDDFPPCQKREWRSPISPPAPKNKRTSWSPKARASPEFLGAWDKIIMASFSTPS